MKEKEETKLGWMPLYFDKFLGGTTEFDGAEIGAYFLLIAYQWKEGHIPTDMKRIVKIARVPKNKLVHVLAKFKKVSDDKMQNSFCEKVRMEQTAKYQTNSVKGKMAAEKRWKKDATGIPQALHKHEPSIGFGNAEERNKNKENTIHHQQQQIESHDAFAEKIFTEAAEGDRVNLELGLNPKRLITKQEVAEFNAHLFTENKHHVHWSEWKSHLRNWLNTKPKDKKHEQRTITPQQQTTKLGRIDRETVSNFLTRRQGKQGSHGDTDSEAA